MAQSDHDTSDTKTTSPARRRLLRAVTAGAIGASALPSRWTTPVVNSVVLPAHAAATACPVQIRSTFTDETARSLGVFDSADKEVASVCCDSPLEINLADLPPGTYTVSMGAANGISTTLQVTTCTSTCSITKELDGGQENGRGVVMATFTVPDGICAEAPDGLRNDGDG
jgi:hypothetical protein